MAAGTDAEFARVFERLKGIVEPYARQYHVSYDQSSGYGVDMAPEGERDPTSWFAGVRIGKAYVSYYLMPVYVEPSLLDDISPELRRRMQGKSCFNFRSVDDGLFAELAELTRRGYERGAGDPGWSTRRREVHDMTHRRARTAPRRS
ncbi:MAG: DUF1801 domain-containing protein [Chloroflexi bacterium]|nr:DUF1801 domain-containing protein [Chloroflexota bacterium]